MAIELTCPQCQRPCSVGDRQDAGPVHCPACGAEFARPTHPPTGVPASGIPPADADRTALGQTHPCSHPASVGASWPADLRHAGATIPAFMASRGLKSRSQLPGTSGAEPTGAAALEADAQGQRYRVGEVVAKGGMGAILAVQDRNVRRTVAMKVMLHPEDVTEQEELRFIEEAQVTGQLEHPGIVPVYELGVDGADHVYYTMKLLHGATLKDILAGIAGAKPGMAQQYPLSRLLTVFQKICDALAFAHTKGVIHRDLKPANIMVGDFGEVLVLDWGLAKIVGQDADRGTAADGSSPAGSSRVESTRGDAAAGDAVTGLRTLDGEIVGTPEFMAPEQALGKVRELDARTDIYALGAMLYTLLALRPPVAGQDSGQVLQAVARGEIVPPSELGHGSSRPLTGKAAERLATRGLDPSPELRPPAAARAVFPHCPHGTIPPALSAIAMKALARQPEARYATVKELQADIERYQGGFATVAEHAGLGRQLALLLRRHKGFVTATAAVFVAVVAGLVVSLAQWRKAVRNEGVAVAARAQAEASRQTAEQRRAQAEAEQYRAMIGLAAAAIAQDNAARGRQTLGGCPGALRHWEWGYLSAQCRRIARAYLPGSAGAYPLAQCAAGDVVTCPAWSDRLLCFDVVRGAKTVEVALPWKKRGSHRVAVLPGSQRVAIIANQPADRLAVVDLAEKRVLWVAEVRCGLLPDVAATADGSHLVVCAEGDGEGATLWDAVTGERLGRFGENRGIVRRVACAPQGARAVLAGAGAGVYDLADGREIGTLADDAKYIWHVGFSPDGTRIATADGDGRVRVWDTATLTCSTTLGGHAGAVAAFAFTPDGTRVLTGGRDRCLRAWRVETGCLEAEKILPQPIAGILVTADGSTAVVGSGTGARRLALAAWLAGIDADMIAPHGFERICRSPNGDRLLVVNPGGTSLLDTERFDVKASLPKIRESVPN